MSDNRVPGFSDAIQGYIDGSQKADFLVQHTMRQLKTLAKCVRLIFRFVVHLLAISAEVLLHSRLGERHFTPITALLGLVALSVVADATTNTPDDGSIALMFIVVYILASLFHLIAIQLRNRRCERWHSFSPGLSWSIWGRLSRNPWRIAQVYEPGLLVVIGIALLPFTGFATYFFLAAGALVVRTAIDYGFLRRKLLDAVDSQIESEFMGDAMQGTKSPRETSGFVVPGAGSWKPHECRTLTDIASGLDPRLQELLVAAESDDQPANASLSMT